MAHGIGSLPIPIEYASQFEALVNRNTLEWFVVIQGVAVSCKILAEPARREAKRHFMRRSSIFLGRMYSYNMRSHLANERLDEASHL